MTTKFRVTSVGHDDDFVTEGKAVRLGTSGDVSFETPLKAGAFGMRDGCRVYDAYRNLKPETIAKCLDNQNYCARYERTTASMGCPGAMSIVSLSYMSGTAVPGDDAIRMMADIQYSCSDVVVTPSWFRLVKGDGTADVDLYRSLSSAYLEHASFRNHKPVMGTIPVCIPYRLIGDVLGMYLDEDVTSFVVDFNARSYNMTWMREFLRTLRDYRVEGESVLACVNCFPGTMKSSGEPTEALDFLGFAAGFDIVCDKHIPKQSSESYPRSDTARVFDGDTFAYTRRGYSSEDEKKSIVMESNRRQVVAMQQVRGSLAECEPLDSLFREKRVDESVTLPFRFMKKGMNVRPRTLDSFFSRSS